MVYGSVPAGVIVIGGVRKVLYRLSDLCARPPVSPECIDPAVCFPFLPLVAGQCSCYVENRALSAADTVLQPVHFLAAALGQRPWRVYVLVIPGCTNSADGCIMAG